MPQEHKQGNCGRSDISKRYSASVQYQLLWQRANDELLTRSSGEYGDCITREWHREPGVMLLDERSPPLSRRVVRPPRMWWEPGIRFFMLQRRRSCLPKRAQRTARRASGAGNPVVEVDPGGRPGVHLRKRARTASKSSAKASHRRGFGVSECPVANLRGRSQVPFAQPAKGPRQLGDRRRDVVRWRQPVRLITPAL